MTDLDLERAVANGPTTFDEALALKREFVRCCQAVLAETNTREQAYYFHRLKQVGSWGPAWIALTNLEPQRRCRLPVPIPPAPYDHLPPGVASSAQDDPTTALEYREQVWP